MGKIEEIIKTEQEKKNGAVSPSGVAENQDRSAVATTSGTTPTSTDGVPSDPYNYNDDVWNMLGTVGITKDWVNALKEKKSYLDLFEQTTKKPEPLDERKLGNAHLFSSIGESVKLLGDLYAAGRGAHIRARDGKDSLTTRTAAREKELRDLYEQRVDRYNAGLLNAKLADRKEQLDEYGNVSKTVMDAFNNSYKRDQEKAAFDHRKGMDEREIAVKEQSARDTKNYHDAMAKASQTRAASRQATASSGSKGKYQVVLEANPNDSDYTIDRVGKKVKVLELSEGEVDYYARAALADANFMNAHPELILQKPNAISGGQFRYRPNKDIAAAYVKDLYDNSFNTPVTVLRAYPPGVIGVAKNTNLSLEERRMALKGMGNSEAEVNEILSRYAPDATAQSPAAGSPPTGNSQTNGNKLTVEGF
ncbi:MAG: hypothetical protein LBQ73_09165 [Tannerellaceae bacterium]|jgi:hypothetical protein|nr:hypothetical protein [Tannerellaceae bacterium]